MSDQPLHPFSPPTTLPGYIPTSVSGGMLLEWFLYFVFAFWIAYTIIAVYHWLKYSHASLVAFPAIALHLFISLSLMTYVLTGAIPQL